MYIEIRVHIRIILKNIMVYECLKSLAVNYINLLLAICILRIQKDTYNIFSGVKIFGDSFHSNNDLWNYFSDIRIGVYKTRLYLLETLKKYI